MCAHDAGRLRERGHEQVGTHVQRSAKACAARTENAGRVRLVDHEDRSVLPARLGQLAQRGAIAVHGKDGVGDHQLAARASPREKAGRCIRKH